MGSVGSNKAITSEVSTFSYDIEDYAAQHGYDTAEEMVKDNLTADNEFFTRDNEMVEYVEDMGYEVVTSPNGEYFTVMDDRDDSDSEFLVYYEKSGSSRYITKVKKA